MHNLHVEITNRGLTLSFRRSHTPTPYEQKAAVKVIAGILQKDEFLRHWLSLEVWFNFQ